MIRVGWLFDQDWTSVKANNELKEVLFATLHVAASRSHLASCIGARIGNGIAILEGVRGCDDSYLWWWKRGDIHNSYYCRIPGQTRIKLGEMLHKDKEPDAWRLTSFTQFLLADESKTRQVRRQHLQVPKLGGPGLA
jgi:hypothetical protein